MERKDYRLAAILYTDIAGFSKMMEKNEARTLELLNIHNELITAVVHAHRGTVIKTIGDAFLIDFKNTVDALQGAIEIQYKLLNHNKQNPDLPLLVRIGLHLGDIYFYENDALGEGINIASRLQSIAHPGCICMSQDVYNMVLNKVDFTAEKLGRVSLKNISKEIHAYEIATPNIDFDPNRTARPILIPDEAEKAVSDSVDVDEVDESDNHIKIAQTDSTKTKPGFKSPKPVVAEDENQNQRNAEEIERQAQKAREIDIKRRIMLDIKSAGRRLGADQMMIRYGSEGAVAAHVVEELAAKGILLRQAAQPDEVIPDNYAPTPASGSGRPTDSIVHAVTSLEYRIEDEIKRGLSEAFGKRRGAGGAEMRRSVRDAAREFRTELRGELHVEHRGDKQGPETTKEEVKWDDKIAKSYFRSTADSLSEYDSYTAKARSEARNSKVGFMGHAATFIAVNAFLMVLNATLTPTFPWALFPFGGWGIGLLEHFASLLRRGERVKDISKLPPLDGDRLSLFKKIQKKRDSIFLHFTSTVTTTTFLAMINLITTPGGFKWFLFPAGGMLIGLISHAASYFATKNEAEKEFLNALGVSGSWDNALGGLPRPLADHYGDLGPYRDLMDTAIATRAAILTQASASKKKNKRGFKSSNPLDEEFIPTLDSYVDQIALIANRTLEVDRIIDLIPMDALNKDKADLVAKIATSTNDSLRREYQKSLQEIEKQESSFKELKDQREVLELRMRSSVNTLKQMRIDLARLSSMPEQDESASAQAVKDKTAELHRYLDDLRAGYAELENIEDKRFLVGEKPKET